MDAMTRPGQNGDATDTETLMLMSGVALVVFGAGLTWGAAVIEW